ncbi:LSD1 zinc finger [Musa troglodytarum]|uniref:LSD1 zinc finger n=1 Tax=Musa troglodytarum TaxID=320322 RepID=A0A9E7KAP9_9LILI|nr:LSD1 zinc finger [Musa troglodytarum]
MNLQRLSASFQRNPPRSTSRIRLPSAKELTVTSSPIEDDDGIALLIALGLHLPFGSRNVLVSPRGATDVRCAICGTTTAAPPIGMKMVQLVCRGCRTMLMYAHGATSVRCSCCHTMNMTGSVFQVPGRFSANQVAHLNCGQCHSILIYPYGAPCDNVQFATTLQILGYNLNPSIMHNMRFPVHVARRPNEPTPVPPSISVQYSRASNMTVVVENPMSVNENVKLESNIVVGVTTGKK